MTRRGNICHEGCEGCEAFGPNINKTSIFSLFLSFLRSFFPSFDFFSLLGSGTKGADDLYQYEAVYCVVRQLAGPMAHDNEMMITLKQTNAVYGGTLGYNKPLARERLSEYTAIINRDPGFL